ncbi:MAG: hypothetical protein HY925_02570, partial [Elusimicrobia bacterium]|nr:hypothetical protein [Elusimicrobiota bacterium]
MNQLTSSPEIPALRERAEKKERRGGAFLFGLSRILESAIPVFLVVVTVGSAVLGRLDSRRRHASARAETESQLEAYRRLEARGEAGRTEEESARADAVGFVTADELKDAPNGAASALVRAAAAGAAAGTPLSAEAKADLEDAEAGAVGEEEGGGAGFDGGSSDEEGLGGFERLGGSRGAGHSSASFGRGVNLGTVPKLTPGMLAESAARGKAASSAFESLGKARAMRGSVRAALAGRRASSTGKA